MDYSMPQLIFIFSAAMLLIAAILAVSVRNLVHAALWMILSFFGVAILFVLLGTGFFAVIQVVIYIGAIAVLILFVIMLTTHEVHDHELPSLKTRWLGALAVLVLLAVLILALQILPISHTLISQQSDDGMVQSLGKALVEPSQFGLVFELASILLLITLIGAIYLARDRNSQNGDVQ